MSRIFLVLAVLAAGWFLMPIFAPEAPTVAGQRVPFAEERAPEQNEQPGFDGKRAIGYLKAVCDIGPRMSGTPGMQKQQELIKKHFETLGVKLQAQTFTAKQKSQPKSVEMTNL